MKRISSLWLTVTYALGAVLVFVGERLFGNGNWRGASTTLGVLLMVVTAVASGARLSALDAERKSVERRFLWLKILGLVGLALYLLQSDIGAKVLGGKLLEQTSPKLAGVIGVLYPTLFALALLPLFVGELAYQGMSRAPKLEAARVLDAVLTGLGFVAIVVFAFSAYYVSDARDAKADLSYFRTTRPGEATRNFVRAMAEPVQVSLFFPPGNDVGDLVKEYFTDLGRGAPRLEVRNFDQAVDPAKARELNVTQNGTIVVARGTRHESLNIQTELDRARGDLKQLDTEVMKKLSAVAKTRRNIYLTVGHGERAPSEAIPMERRATVRAFRDLLKDQNYEIRDLSAATGLATEVPKDAAAVFVLGPTVEFIPEEQQALKKYFEEGGRIFYALDPEAGQSYSGLMAPLGVTFYPVQLANDHVFIPHAHADADHANLVTATFSSSPAVTSLAQSRAPVVFLGAGYLEAQKTKPKGVSVDFSVLAQSETFNDTNGNYTLDAPAEVKKAYPLEAAVTLKRPGKEDGRAVVLADSDGLTDVGVFENKGNNYLALDAAKWLVGDDANLGAVNSETDVPLEHTHQQDEAWFYATIFLAPAIVLGAGWGATRRKRRAS